MTTTASSSSPVPPTPTTGSASTTTTPGNGISTPTPTQPNMVDNCSEFYYVKDGGSCAGVLDANGITLQQLYEWNPSVGEDCAGLWAEVYVCVNVIGRTPDPTTLITSTAAPTPTVSLPSPIQTPVVSNRNRYHKVASSSTTCQAIADYWGIKLDEVKAWNPSINSDCSNLKVSHYVCVGILPSPIQEPVAVNCNKYHQVASSSTTCQAIADYNHIRLDDFYKWNPSISRSCTNLWVHYYVCVGVPGAVSATPTTTTTTTTTTTAPGNGVATPTPIQPNMTKNCKSFHRAEFDTTTCQGIADYRGIKLSDFLKWNPDVGGETCPSLWKGYWYCYAVLYETALGGKSVRG